MWVRLRRRTGQARQTKAPAQTYLDMELTDVNDDKRADLMTSCGDVFLRQPDGTLAEMPSFHLTPPAGEPQS